MGSDTFRVVASGKTAETAFTSAVKDALHEYGHHGYTGTIAEKSEFVLIEVPTGRSPREFADDLLENDDERVDDKWGPAGCVKLTDDKWLFFGRASS